ncbi:hypothetical protein PoB_003387100 [Plakobranchus ocellatus]|uniref:Uncharacterized protein n=1 Tax=Plakobranchus ocellatus TaxID=259542 RepID=A0AAV4ALB6_9GAST|nr:hypothetical protein PoB_003387100 [Plakobranchus ocellatus]
MGTKAWRAKQPNTWRQPNSGRARPGMGGERLTLLSAHSLVRICHHRHIKTEGGDGGGEGGRGGRGVMYLTDPGANRPIKRRQSISSDILSTFFFIQNWTYFSDLDRKTEGRIHKK